MNKDEFIRYVSSELEHGRDIDLEYQINGIPYKIKFLPEWEDKRYAYNKEGKKKECWTIL